MLDAEKQARIEKIREGEVSFELEDDRIVSVE